MANKIKLLELFAGSRSVGKVAEELGYDVFSVDINNFNNIDYVIDILNFDYDEVPFIPDIIWASPPCTYFSVASIGHHWNKNHTPKTKEVVLGCEIVLKTISIIKHYKPKYFYIENPRGKLRKLNFMKEFDRTTVWYCRYGDRAAKPTDIWSNHIYSLFNSNGWQPRQECFNGNKKCHHETAPRGSTIKKLKEKGIIVKKGGTQAKKDNYERSKIPYELCKEILLSI